MASFHNHHYLKNRYPWAWSQKITDGPIIEVWENILNYILKYLKMENWFIIQKMFHAELSSPWTYWCWGIKITSLRKWFSSKGKDDEQFKLKSTRSTLRLSLDHDEKSSLCHLPLLFCILFEWNNTWLWHKRRLSPPSIAIMNLGKGTFRSPAACIPFLVWLGQESLFN
jgi:hypothetical protein